MTQVKAINTDDQGAFGGSGLLKDGILYRLQQAKRTKGPANPHLFNVIVGHPTAFSSQSTVRVPLEVLFVIGVVYSALGNKPHLAKEFAFNTFNAIPVGAMLEPVFSSSLRHWLLTYPPYAATSYLRNSGNPKEHEAQRLLLEVAGLHHQQMQGRPVAEDKWAEMRQSLHESHRCFPMSSPYNTAMDAGYQSGLWGYQGDHYQATIWTAMRVAELWRLKFDPKSTSVNNMNATAARELLTFWKDFATEVLLTLGRIEAQFEQNNGKKKAA